MRWISTRGSAPATTFRTALLEGLAPDGGLYLPERLDPIPQARVDALRGGTVADVGTEIAAHLIEDEIPRERLSALVHDALNFPIPLVDLDAGPAVQVLELFHGPTFAFKDIGARTMARLMAEVAGETSLTVLVATSGDTGSAVAQAFAGVAATRVVVLFPDGQVSDVQEAQFTTLGGNVQAVAVSGTFDDCQALVKAAFADQSLRSAVRLTSANSINVGRLVPQVFYYAWMSIAKAEAFALRHQGQRHPAEHGERSARASALATISVPSGNFGNLTAGLIAKRLGFPLGHFIAATNINDVVPQYLASGRYEPRASVRTVANAMDVGAPSNFERIGALYGHDLSRVREDMTGAAFDDAAVTRAIADVYARYDYVLDPHSAIAWLGLDGRPGTVLATAHPAKFREVVEPAIGRPVPLPRALAEALERPRLVARIPADYASLREVLR